MAKFLKRPLAVLLCLLTLLSLFAVAVPTMASTRTYSGTVESTKTGKISISTDGTGYSYVASTYGASKWYINGSNAICVSPDNPGPSTRSGNMTKYYFSNDSIVAKMFYYLVPRMKSDWSDSLRTDTGINGVNNPDYPKTGFWRVFPGNVYGSKPAYKVLDDCLGANGKNVSYTEEYFLAHYAISLAFAGDTTGDDTITYSSKKSSYDSSITFKSAAVQVYKWFRNNNSKIADVPNYLRTYYVVPDGRDAGTQAMMGIEDWMGLITVKKYDFPETGIIEHPEVRKENGGYYTTEGTTFAFYATKEDAVASRNKKGEFSTSGTYKNSGGSSYSQGSHYIDNRGLPSNADKSKRVWYLREIKAGQGYKTEIESVRATTGCTAEVVDAARGIIKISNYNVGKFDIEVSIKDNKTPVPLKIIKKDRDTGALLGGATFKITFSDDVNFKSPIATVTTGADGSITRVQDLLFVGREYLVREIKAPEGYDLAPNVADRTQKITLQADDAKNPTKNIVTFLNKKSTIGGSIVIKKKPKPECEGFIKDNPNYTVEGAKFAIYEDKDSKNQDKPSKSSDITSNAQRYEKLWDVETDSSGIAKLDVNNISLGSVYYAIETKAPDGFLISDEVKKFEFNSQADFENEAKCTTTFYDSAVGDPVDVAVVKKGSYGSVPLKDAYFRLDYYTEVTNGNTVPKSNPKYSWVIVSDSNGEAVFDNGHLDPTMSTDKVIPSDFLPDGETGRAFLPKGTLVVKEIKAPNNYLLDDKEYVIHLTGKSDRQSINTESEEIEPVVIVDRAIPNINYSIKKLWEDNNNNDGMRPETLDITVNAYKDEETLVGTDDDGNPVYEKVKANSVEALLSDGSKLSTTFPYHITLSADSWSGSINNLPEGYWDYSGEGIMYKKYIYEFEEAEITGYVKDQDYIEPKIEKVDDSNYTVTFKNKHDDESTIFGLTKAWDDDNNSAGLRPEWASFELYASTNRYDSRDMDAWFNQAEKVLVDANGDNIGRSLNKERTSDGVIYVTDDDVSYSNHGENVRFTYWVDNLPKYKNGIKITYLAKEVNINPNYAINQSNISMAKADIYGGSLFYHSWKGSDGSNHSEKLMAFKYTNHIKTGTLTVNKIDGEGNALGGAGFQVFKVEGGKKTAISATYNEETSRYSYNSKGTEATTMLVDSEAGSLVVDKLPIGDYVLKETVTPEGCMPFEDEISFSIKEDKLNVSKDMKADKTVENNKVVLPETGGIGDSWIYGIGVIALIGVVALTIILIVRKISKKEKKNNV